MTGNYATRPRLWESLKMAATGGKLLAGRLALVTGKIGENISNKIELFSYIG